MIRFLKRIGAHAIHRYERDVARTHLRRFDPILWGLRVTSKDHLAIGPHDLSDLAGTFGTPLHVLHQEQLEANLHNSLESARRAHQRTVLAYSYKTNPVPAALQLLHSLGAYAEVVSQFELWLALRLNVSPASIIFNGPGKTQDAIDLAVSHDILLINIDNMDEINRIETTARRHRRKQSVGIRVVTSVGWSGQFGLSIRSGTAHEAARRIHASEHLRLRGLHLHLGPGIDDQHIFSQAISELLGFAHHLRAALGISIDAFDLGGGFGVATVRKFDSIDDLLLRNQFPARRPWLTQKKTFAARLPELIGKIVDHAGFHHHENSMLIFEPGRAISSSAQLLLLSVLALKKIRNDTTAVILDGGRDIVMPPEWEQHALFHATKTTARGARFYDLHGPLCHPGDLLFRSIWLPDLAVGDLVAIMDTGAYFIPNQMNFSNPRPAIVSVGPVDVRLIRQRESFADMIELDRFDFEKDT